MNITAAKEDNSLSRRVYEYLMGQIQSGRLRAGQKITEAAISQILQISRSPVREALKRLAEDKLVVLVPRSGCYINDITVEEVDELYEIRKRLECMALEYALDKINDRKIEELRNKFVACLDLQEPEHIKKSLRLDHQLHRLIIASSGCLNLPEILAKFDARMQLFRIRNAYVADHSRRALQEHIAIAEAILRKDKDAAVRLLAAHLENTKNDLLAAAEENQNQRH